MPQNRSAARQPSRHSHQPHSIFSETGGPHIPHTNPAAPTPTASGQTFPNTLGRLQDKHNALTRDGRPGRGPGTRGSPSGRSPISDHAARRGRAHDREEHGPARPLAGVDYAGHLPDLTCDQSKDRRRPESGQVVDRIKWGKGEAMILSPADPNTLTCKYGGAGGVRTHDLTDYECPRSHEIHP